MHSGEIHKYAGCDVTAIFSDGAYSKSVHSLHDHNYEAASITKLGVFTSSGDAYMAICLLRAIWLDFFPRVDPKFHQTYRNWSLRFCEWCTYCLWLYLLGGATGCLDCVYLGCPTRTGVTPYWEVGGHIFSDLVGRTDFEFCRVIEIPWLGTTSAGLTS